MNSVGLTTPVPRVALIGYGDIASRLSALLAVEGWQIKGLRRSVNGCELPPGTELMAGDCRVAETLREVLEGQDAVVCTLTPDRYSEQGYRDTYVTAARVLAEVLPTLRTPPRLVLWVSSTGVYGQHSGEWVDESSETKPLNFSGRCLLEAEQQVAGCGVDYTIVRMSGIYGPGRRRLIEQVLRREFVPAAPPLWTNRIHADDGAGVLHHLLNRFWRGQGLASLYLATDCEPVCLYEVQQWLARQLGMTPSAEGKAVDEVRRGNRCCRNQRLLDSGYVFRYPTYCEGYQALLGNP